MKNNIVIEHFPNKKSIIYDGTKQFEAKCINCKNKICMKYLKSEIQNDYAKIPTNIDDNVCPVDAIKTAELCIEAFKKDKNLEHLCDAANYLMFRFKYPMDGEEYKHTDSDKSVGTVGTPINMENEY